MLKYLRGNKGGLLMIDAESCRKIIKQYYKEIYNYCYAKLRYNHHSAEDCTQDVFVAFASKSDRLEESAIRVWLYRTADNVIKAYMRKNNTSMTVSIEESPEALSISDSSDFTQKESPLDVLTQEERNILTAYYNSDYGDKNVTAKKLGLTLPALYQRIHKIKQKLRDSKY